MPIIPIILRFSQGQRVVAVAYRRACEIRGPEDFSRALQKAPVGPFEKVGSEKCDGYKPMPNG